MTVSANALPMATSVGPLTLTTLGSASLRSSIEGAEGLGPGKPLALVTFLHGAPAQTASRDQLIELLWSDVDREKSRHTLRQTFWYIRRRLGIELFEHVGDTVRIAVPVASDRQAFLEALDADELESAIQHYAGDFFPGFAAPGGAAFEQWADVERTRCRSLYVGAVTRVVRDLLSKGRARDAMLLARRAVELVDNHQGAWRLLLEAAMAINDGISLTVELERVERWLAQHDIEPDAATLQLVKAARQGRAGTEPSTPGAQEPRTLATELVGREGAFADLVSAFEAAKRGVAGHVHIAAPAGLGKTRLLTGFAARLRSARARVVMVHASPGERALPYAFAAQIVSALVTQRGAAAISPDAASALVALAPAASSYLNAQPDKSTGDESLRRRSLALIELAESVAQDSALALLIDDVHWVDAQSLQMLSSLAGRLDGGSLLLVTAARPNDRLSDQTTPARRITLEPLSIDDVGALLMSVGRLPQESWSDRFVQVLHAASQGSPLLVLETLQLMLERGTIALSGDRWIAPDPDRLVGSIGVGQAMQQRIAALPASARDALLRLAVAGTAVSEATTGRLLAADGRESLPLLETRGFITRVGEAWQVAHDEIAAMAIALSSQPDRDRANQAHADLLEHDEQADQSVLLRAAQHRARANDSAALDRVFARVARRAHVTGEHAALRALAHEVLGASAEPARVEALISRLPRSVRHRRRRWALLTTLLVAVAALIFTVRPTTSMPTSDVVMTMLVRDDHGAAFASLPVMLAELTRSEPLDVVPTTAPFSTSVLDSNTVYDALASGDFIGSTLTAAVASNGTDLVQLSPQGRVRALTTAAHDQTGAIVSPDGQRVAYLSGEWHPAQRGEIMLMDSVGLPARRMTNTDAAERSLAWSRDGSRIAFVRSHSSERPAELCWMLVNGQRESCRLLPSDYIPAYVLAWSGDNQVLMIARRRPQLSNVLMLVDFASSAVTPVDSSGSDYAADPQARVVSCSCLVSGYAEPVTAVFSPNTPLSKRVIFRDGKPLAPGSVPMRFWGHSRDYLDTLRIVESGPMYVGQVVTLTVRGADAAGRRRAVPSLFTWRSLDTTIAIIDTSGTATMRRSGVARLVVDLGGWRADTVRLTIREPSHVVTLRETWAPGWNERWMLVGDPLASAAGAPATLRVNGDEHLDSGVGSHASVVPTNGAGMEARVRLPITIGQWQWLNVALDPIASDDVVRRWPAGNEQSGLQSLTGERSHRSCSVRIPPEEGGQYIDLLALDVAGHAVPVTRTPRVADGEWHTLVLQLFSDGRCALAIDGILVARSKHAAQIDRPLRVWISGQSVGTKLEVGSVTAWTGVRADITWTTPGRR